MTKYRFTLLMAISACIIALAAQMALTPAAKARSNGTTATVAPDSDDGGTKISVRSVFPIIGMMPGSVPVPAAGSELIRTRNGVFMSLTTKNLNPGWVYTAWLGIFNNPRACATNPCSGADFANPAVQGSRVNVGGRIIGADGSATYGAFLGIGDTASAFDGPGLLRPRRAEIHEVVRSHGPALMGALLTEQLSMFNGGCPPNMCANVQISIHQVGGDDDD